MPRTCLSVLLLLLLGAIFNAPGAHAGALRISLLDAAEVRGDAILLSDLLPKDAPDFLREASERISLGRAPQYGSSRLLSREVVLAAVIASGLQAYAFQIPENMTVQRASHSVTREEAFDAIRRALSTNQGLAFPTLQPEDISFDAIQLSDQASHLAVTDMAVDDFLGRARFRLRATSAPSVPPFYVTAKLPLRTGAAVASVPALVSESVPSLPASPILIEAGQFVRLYLHSANSSMLLQVKSLQRGRLGEIIRVRLPANGKTFHARVLPDGDLDASL